MEVEDSLVKLIVGLVKENPKLTLSFGLGSFHAIANGLVLEGGILITTGSEAVQHFIVEQYFVISLDF
jgi:hypothetical protein